MVVAKHSGKEVSLILDKDAVLATKKESPLGSLPVLECEEGLLSNSMAIARYLADYDIEGKSDNDMAVVDQWL